MGNLTTLVWATAAQGESTYGLTYRCGESLQCCCDSEDSSEMALPWAGAGQSGTAQTLAHLYLHPVPWLFPQHSLTSAYCTASLSARSCEPLICLYTLWQSYGVLPFGTTCLLFPAFRPPSGSAAQQPSALACVPRLESQP